MGVYESIAKNREKRVDESLSRVVSTSQIDQPDLKQLFDLLSQPGFIEKIAENNPRVKELIEKDLSDLSATISRTTLSGISDYHIPETGVGFVDFLVGAAEGVVHPGFGSSAEVEEFLLLDGLETTGLEEPEENISKLEEDITKIREESLSAFIGNIGSLAVAGVDTGVQKALGDFTTKIATLNLDIQQQQQLIRNMRDTLESIQPRINNLNNMLTVVEDAVSRGAPGITIEAGNFRFTYSSLDELVRAEDFLSRQAQHLLDLDVNTRNAIQLSNTEIATLSQSLGKLQTLKEAAEVGGKFLQGVGTLNLAKQATGAALTYSTKDTIQQFINTRSAESEGLLKRATLDENREEAFAQAIRLLALTLLTAQNSRVDLVPQARKAEAALTLTERAIKYTGIAYLAGNTTITLGPVPGAVALFASLIPSLFGSESSADDAFYRLFNNNDGLTTDFSDPVEQLAFLADILGSEEIAGDFLLNLLEFGGSEFVNEIVEYDPVYEEITRTTIVIRPEPGVLNTIKNAFQEYSSPTQVQENGLAYSVVPSDPPIAVLYFDPETNSYQKTNDQTAGYVTAETSTFRAVDGTTYEYIVAALDYRPGGISSGTAAIVASFLQEEFAGSENSFARYALAGGETVEITQGVGDFFPGTYVYNSDTKQWCLVQNGATILTGCYPENAILVYGARVPTAEELTRRTERISVPGLREKLIAEGQEGTDTQNTDTSTYDTEVAVDTGTGGDPSTAPSAAGVETLTLALDSDQCKISRLYEPLEEHFKTLSAGASTVDLFLCGKNLKMANTNASYVPNKSDTADKFYVNPDTFSGLVPDYQLFKVYRQYSTGNNQIGDITAIHQIKFPKTITNARDVSADIDQIGANATEEQKKAIFSKIANEMKLDNIGVKSIDWHYEGTDRFTADKVISAQVVLFMENFDALFTERTVLGADGKPAYTYKISDLLIHPECVKGSRPTRTSPDAEQTVYSSQERSVYNPGCYEILLKAGYLDNPGMYSSLYLSLIGHQFSFQENGSVEVTINYRGRIEAVLRSATADIKLDNNGTIPETLAVALDGLSSEAGRGILKRTTETAEQKESVLGALDTTSSTMPDRVAADPNASFDRGSVAKDKYTYERGGSVSDAVKKIEGAKTRLEAKGTRTAEEEKDLQIIKGVLAQVDKEVVLQFFGRVSKVLIDNNRVFNLNVKNSNELKAYLQTPTIATLKTLIDFIGATNVLNAERLAAELDNPLGQSNPAGGPAPAGPMDTPSSRIVSVNEDGTEADSSDNGGGSEADPAAAPEVSAEKNIPYVYFGHLIDAIIYVCQGRDTTTRSNILDDAMVVLPNIMMPSKSSNFSSLKPISMAGIPVAITTIMNFANIRAESGQKAFTFYALLRDLVNEVLIEALGVQCPERRFMPVYKPNILQYTRFNKTLNSYSTSNAIQATGGGAVTGQFDLKNFINSSREILFDTASGGARTLNSVTAFVPSVEIENYNEISSGNKETDRAKGIPHFTFGSNNNGLFIKCDLQKVDQPYLVESRFTDTNGSILTQFSNIYNASLEMIGNDLFTLGDYVFLNFQTMANSLGSPNTSTSLSYFMGLGGLHLITDIKTTMTPGSYKTVIQARYVGRGGKAQGAQT
jgi:hypothetical protein